MGCGGGCGGGRKASFAKRGASGPTAGSGFQSRAGKLKQDYLHIGKTGSRQPYSKEDAEAAKRLYQGDVIRNLDWLVVADDGTVQSFETQKQAKDAQKNLGGRVVDNR